MREKEYRRGVDAASNRKSALRSTTFVLVVFNIGGDGRRKKMMVAEAILYGRDEAEHGVSVWG